MYCIKCGTQLPDNADICSNCGEPVYKTDDNNQGNNYQQTPPNNQYQQAPPFNNQYGQPPYQNAYNQYPPNAKSAYLAGLLAIIVGVFGIHNFYLGNTGKAIAQLLITVLSCGIFAFIVEVWTIVEGIQLFTGTINVDADGVPLKKSF